MQKRGDINMGKNLNNSWNAKPVEQMSDKSLKDIWD